MNKKLLIAAAALLIIAVIVHLILNWPSKNRSPQELFDAAMNAPDPAQREAAAIELIQYGEKQDNPYQDDLAEILTLIRRLVKEGKSAEVRSAAILGLSHDWDSIPTLIEGMRDESALVRGRAAAACGKLLGARYQFDPKAEEKAREEVIRQMQASFDNMDQYKEHFQHINK